MVWVPSEDVEQALTSSAEGHPVLQQLARLVASAGASLTTMPPSGYRRGLDFYRATNLLRVLCTAADQFREAMGRDPNILVPEVLSDKLFWSKFFRPFKIPESGNKLLTSSFIPAEVRSDITCPEIVWHSTTPRVPRGNEIEPGVYYLKATHGSDMFDRVRYPLSDAEAETLDGKAATYLKHRFGILTGEWWYNAFQPEIMLEKSVTVEPLSIAWCFFVFHGEVAMIAPYQKRPDGPRKVYLRPDFEPVGEGSSEVRLKYAEPSPATKEAMLSAARVIGRPFGFVRVDFLIGPGERVYLNELTFSPGNGLTPRSRELDQKLGAMWNLAGL